ncbi:50S ribosomal protein L44e [Candidatus Pacearchaeota archaeon]|nr:50S ribosomal protein L44e [Candidatus Pacearchaeota archaeon]
MKIPKKSKRYCPFCNEHTEQKVDIVSTGHKRGTLKYGSLWRAKKRGAMPGTGNKGRYSKRAVKSRKMKTKTTTRKVLIYTCQKCKKSLHARSRRVSKLMIE